MKRGNWASLPWQRFNTFFSQEAETQEAVEVEEAAATFNNATMALPRDPNQLQQRLLVLVLAPTCSYSISE